LRRGLHAIGIGPTSLKSPAEEPRETSGITYLNAFAGIAVDHPFVVQRSGKPDLDEIMVAAEHAAIYELVYPKDRRVSGRKKVCEFVDREQLANSAAGHRS
jgi:hypothetical protein